MATQFFSSFPHENFPYDDSVMPFIEILLQTGDEESAKKHLDILTTELYQRLRFYDSLEDTAFESFRQDYGYALRGTSEIRTAIKGISDEEFTNRIKGMIDQYDISKLRQ